MDGANNFWYIDHQLKYLRVRRIVISTVLSYDFSFMLIIFSIILHVFEFLTRFSKKYNMVLNLLRGNLYLIISRIG